MVMLHVRTRALRRADGKVALPDAHSLWHVYKTMRVRMG